MSASTSANRDRGLWPVVWLVAAGAAYLAGLTLRTVWTARSEVPWRDQWVFLDDAREIRAHHWLRLTYSYWGHRPVVARVVTLLDIEWFRGLNTPILVFILTMQALSGALLTWVAWRLFGRYSRPVFAIVTAVIVQLCFTSLQLENLLWAAQSGYILVWTGAIAAFLLLATYAESGQRRGLLLGACVVSAGVSMLSSPNGVFTWPVLLMQAWVLRLGGRVQALMAGVGAIAIGGYLWRYQAGPAMGMGPLRALLHPWQSIPIVGMLSAATLTPVSIRLATAVGCFALAAAVYILVKFVHYHPPARVTVYAALGLFALLTFMSMVASRISPEFVAERIRLDQLVIPSRYYTTVSFFWIGVIGVSIWMAIQSRREWLQLAIAGLMTAVVTLGTVTWQIGEAANWSRFYHELDVAGSGLIMQVSDRANPFLEEIYPETTLRRDVTAWLSRDRLALFAERRGGLLGQRVLSVDKSRCGGIVEKITGIGGGAFRMGGWAIDRRTGLAPRDLVFTSDSGMIVGVARSGLQRPDLRSGSDGVGWQGYARAGGPGAIHVYGALDDAGHYCSVGQAFALPVE